MIVDCHTHVVSTDLTRFPLHRQDHPGGSWVVDSPRTAEQLAAEMQDAGVDRAIAVQAHGAYGNDNSYALHAAETHPHLLASCPAIDAEPTDPETAARRLAKAGAAGVRLFSVPAPQDAWLDTEATATFVQACDGVGLAVTVCALPAEFEAVEKLANRCSGIPIGLDHCGLTYVDSETGPGTAQLWDLAQLPNVGVKLSTNVLDAAGDEHERADFVTELTNHFGPNRIQWGSDYPQTHDRPYEALLALAKQATSHLTREAQNAIMGETAKTFWNLT